MILEDFPDLPRENVITLDKYRTQKINPDVKGDAANLPFPDQTFDVVLDPGVRSYGVVPIELGDRILHEVYRVLKPQTAADDKTGLYLAAPAKSLLPSVSAPFIAPALS